MLAYLALSAVLMSVCAGELVSPCPGLFEYERIDEKGHWEGRLTLFTDYTLHGVWTRLFFDGPVSELKLVGGSAVEIADYHNSSEEDDHKEFLLKNRDLLLKKNEPAKIKFSVYYEGDKAPALIGFRLNGRYLCPEGKE